jgi:NitT/TauT family transport system permease protein
MKQVVNNQKSLIISIISVILFFILWEVVLDIINVSRAVLIKPSEIFVVAFNQHDIIVKELLYTTKEIIPGWIIGNVVGFLVAVLIYKKEKISGKLINTFVLINAIPLIALSAILGGIMGTNIDQKILIISLIIFFPMFITVLSQLRNMEEDHHDLLLTYSATEKDILKKILLPKSLPSILNCIKVSVITAIFSAITAEFFGGYGGIGIFILSKKGLYNLPLVWASIFYIAIFGTIFYFSVEALQKKLTPWQKV